jgi:hypothetical protein
MNAYKEYMQKGHMSLRKGGVTLKMFRYDNRGGMHRFCAYKRETVNGC